MARNNINPVFTQTPSVGLAEVSDATPVLVIQGGPGGLMIQRVSAIATASTAVGKITLYIKQSEVTFTVTLLGDPTDGFFALTVDGLTTLPIPWDAVEADVQAALDLAIGVSGFAIVSGDGPYAVTFTGNVVPQFSGAFALIPAKASGQIELTSVLGDAKMREEIPTPAVTTGPNAQVHSREFTPQTTLWLPEGWQLLASSANSENWNVWAEGGNCG